MFANERVALRAVREEDFLTFHEWWSDPELMAHQTTDPATLRQQAANEEIFQGWCNSGNVVAFSVERAGDGVLVDECNLWGYTAAGQCGTLAIMLGKDYWNQG